MLASTRNAAAASSSGSTSSRVQHRIEVSVRIKPPRAAASTLQVSSDGVEVLGSQQPPFSFMRHVITGSDQEQAFAVLASRLLKTLDDGFSATLLAYGQTGSGKTHTMFGAPGCLTEASLEGLAPGASSPTWGILPRALIALLRTLPASATLHCSAIEVYQDLAYDLLNERSPLVVGRKGANQLGGNEGVAVAGRVGGKTEAVGGTHPAGCRCKNCVAVKEAKAEELKRRMAERRGESYFTGSGSDPFKMKREAAAREKAAAKAAAAPKQAADEKDDFTTVGETLAPLTNPAEVMRFCRTVEVRSQDRTRGLWLRCCCGSMCEGSITRGQLSRTTVGHNLNERSSRSHCLVHVHVAERIGALS